MIGTKVQMHRPLERNHPCCENVCVIGPGKGPHVAELRCTNCGKHRGWLMRVTHEWLTAITRDGMPATPIIISFERLVAHKIETMQREFEARRAANQSRLALTNRRPD
jgi:hypothetical protein